MPGSGPKLCNVTVTVSLRRGGTRTSELFNVPEADVKALQKKWANRNKRRSQTFTLVPVDGRRTDAVRFNVDAITEIKTEPC